MIDITVTKAVTPKAIPIIDDSEINEMNRCVFGPGVTRPQQQLEWQFEHKKTLTLILRIHGLEHRQSDIELHCPGPQDENY